MLPVHTTPVAQDQTSKPRSPAHPAPKAAHPPFLAVFGAAHLQSPAPQAEPETDLPKAEGGEGPGTSPPLDGEVPQVDASPPKPDTADPEAVEMAQPTLPGADPARPGQGGASDSLISGAQASVTRGRPHPVFGPGPATTTETGSDTAQKQLEISSKAPRAPLIPGNGQAAEAHAPVPPRLAMPDRAGHAMVRPPVSETAGQEGQTPPRAATGRLAAKDAAPASGGMAWHVAASENGASPRQAREAPARGRGDPPLPLSQTPAPPSPTPTGTAQTAQLPTMTPRLPPSA
uniref:hypothetical protein n=1 Tax=Roseovarius sp. MMSF_3281 TaxID=3046694 RepID=UPI00273F3C5B